MVIPFSNTKLRVPTGFQTLLVGLSTEVLRSQPRNINAFAADYFEKLLKRREQGQSLVVDNQASLQDRYYNNQSFQEEYPVNDPEVNHAATKIQAKFRGHKARQNVEKMKHDTKDVIDTDQQELGYGRESTGTPNEHQDQILSEREHKSSPMPTERLHHHHHHHPQEENNENVEEEELTEEEKQEQERAARSIQARFRGFKSRQIITPDQQPPHITPDEALHSSRQGHHHAQEWDNERTPTASSARFSDKTDHDRQDFDRDSTTQHRVQTCDNPDIDRPRLEREPTQLSEDFELHIQAPRDSVSHCEQVERTQSDEDNDMDDLNLDKAATRIQASFRGYKARKELGPTGQSSNEHHQQDHDQHSDAHNNNTEGNKMPELEEEDAAAAVKIQAAYRGYRARKDLEK